MLFVNNFLRCLYLKNFGMEKLTQALRDGNWAFKSKNDDTVVIGLNTSDGKFFVNLVLPSGLDVLNVYVHFDIECIRKYKKEMCKMVVTANNYIDIGCLILDWDNGIVSFKSSIFLTGVNITADFISNVICDTVKQANMLKLPIEAICMGEKFENAVLFMD